MVQNDLHNFVENLPQANQVIMCASSQAGRLPTPISQKTFEEDYFQHKYEGKQVQYGFDYGW